MKAILSALSFVLALGICQAQDAQEVTETAPKPIYTCTASISKDWSQIKKESYILLETEPFDLSATEESAVIIKSDSFKVVSDKSNLKSVKESDLGQFELAVRALEKDSSLGLEVTFTLKPKNVSKEVHIVEESPFSSEKTPQSLTVDTKIMFGNDKEVGKSGPVLSEIKCELKRRLANVFRLRKKTSEF